MHNINFVSIIMELEVYLAMRKLEKQREIILIIKEKRN